MGKGRPKLTNIKDDKFIEFIKEDNVLIEQIEMFYKYDSDNEIYRILEKSNHSFDKKTRNRILKYFNRYKKKTGIPVILFESYEKFKYKMPMDAPTCWAKTFTCGDSYFVPEANIENIIFGTGMTKDDYIEFLKDMGFEHYPCGRFQYMEPRLHLFSSISEASLFIYEQKEGKTIKRMTKNIDKKRARKKTKNNIASFIRKEIKKDGLVHNAYGYLIVKVDDIA